MTQALQSGAAPAPSPLLFDAELRPHRSLSRAGLRRVMLGAGLISLVAGLRFWMIGAWPVMLFFVLDLALLWGAFKLNALAARRREHVRLSAQALDIWHVSALGHARTARFEPYWTRVELRHPGQHRAELRIRDRAQHTVVGSFLTKEERADLAQALQEALARLKDSPPAAKTSPA